MPYTEFESLVSVEGLQTFLLQKIFSSESDIQEGLVDLYSQIVTQYWLENSCFEQNIKQIISNEKSVDILLSIMDKFDLLIQMQLQNEDGGEIIQKSSVLIIENQNVYKTLQLVKN